jgi:hypothetical protein
LNPGTTLEIVTNASYRHAKVASKKFTNATFAIEGSIAMIALMATIAKDATESSATAAVRV